MGNGREETLTEVSRKGKVVILRWVSGYSYPRSGNAHNPTPRYTYEKWVNGALVDQSSNLRNLR